MLHFKLFLAFVKNFGSKHKKITLGFHLAYIINKLTQLQETFKDFCTTASELQSLKLFLSRKFQTTKKWSF